MFFIYYIAVR